MVNELIAHGRESVATCRFCDIAISSGSGGRTQDADLCNTVLRETANFFVVPALGSFVLGYVMIISKEHYLCLGELPDPLFGEFLDLKAETTEVITTVFAPPILFEHGSVCEAEKAGCCVSHAHIHVVPVPPKVDLLGRMRDDHLQPIAIEDMEVMRAYAREFIPYLFYEGRDRQKYISEARVIPSQYLRQLLAAEIGLLNKYDWRHFPFLDKIAATVTRLEHQARCGDRPIPSA